MQIEADFWIKNFMSTITYSVKELCRRKILKSHYRGGIT